MPQEITKFAVIQALRTVSAPQAPSTKKGEKGADPEDIFSSNMVSGLLIQNTPEGTEVSFLIDIDEALQTQADDLKQAAERAVKKIKGISKVHAVMTMHKTAGAVSGAARDKAPPLDPSVALGQTPPVKEDGPPEGRVPSSIRHIIAVASGKGGVGKSTTAINLAMALSLNGHKIGILDADVYGPSVPHMMGLTARPFLTEDKKLAPLNQYGIKTMSIGYLVDERAPVIWRGPMVHGAIKQLYHDVDWGDLDVLVVDMPPGTGDAALTLIQQLPLTGVVIVSTPQDIALLDARKSIGLFQKANVPILGIVENMSRFTCPHCGGHCDVFSKGGALAEAETLQVPFLGEVELALNVRETSDAGTPIVRAQPDSQAALSYRNMAHRIWDFLTLHKG